MPLFGHGNVDKMKEKCVEIRKILILGQIEEADTSQKPQLLKQLEEKANEYIDLCKNSSEKDFERYEEEAQQSTNYQSFRSLIQNVSEKLLENEKTDEACGITKETVTVLLNKKRFSDAVLQLISLGEDLAQKMKFDRARDAFEEACHYADTFAKCEEESSGKELLVYWSNMREDCLTSFYACQLCLDSNVNVEGIKPLVKKLNEGELETRLVAANALGLIQSNDAVEPLIQALDDRESIVRREIADALGNIGDKRSGPALIRLLDDPVGIVRFFAVGALISVGDMTAINALEKLRNDPDEDIREYAQQAIEMIKMRLEVFDEES